MGGLHCWRMKETLTLLPRPFRNGASISIFYINKANLAIKRINFSCLAQKLRNSRFLFQLMLFSTYSLKSHRLEKPRGDVRAPRPFDATKKAVETQFYCDM